MGYYVDIALVIDTTGSMEPVIETVKANALSFCADLNENLKRMQKSIDQLRVKVIAFKDFFGDGKESLQASPVLSLPDQNANLRNFVHNLYAAGGGNQAHPTEFGSEAMPPESGLEALAYAIQHTPWTSAGTKCRHIIALWTDAYAHRLEDAPLASSDYPADTPRSLPELTDIWGQKMNASAKRLILFTPDVYPWNILGEEWECVIHHIGHAGSNLAESDYSVILETISNSI